jgi:hypothetical protein
MPKLAIVSLFFLPSLTAADIPNVKPDLRTSAQISSLTLNPTTAVGGAAVSGTVTLTQAAGSGGVTVRFQSSNSAIAAVPPNVVVQPGTTSANFMVQTYPVAMNPNVVTDPPSVEISAQIGLTAPAKVRITIQPPAFASISFNPASVPGGTSTVGQVTFSGPAPSSGLTVTLSTTQPGKPDVDLSTALLRDSSKVNFPRQVTVPAGASSATFSAATRGVTEKLIVPIYASYGTFVTKSATLTLNPPAVASLTINPEHPIGGQSVTGTITLTAAAPTDGATISISRSGSGCGPAPTAPPTVQIPAGAASATFPISTYPGMWWGSFYASGKQATIGVREQIITADTLVFPSSVKGGTPVQAKLVFSTPAGPTNCGLSHKLESNNTTIAQVPASVAPSPGATEAPFTITTSAVPSNQTVTITVYGNVGYGYASYQKTLTLTP